MFRKVKTSVQVWHSSFSNIRNEEDIFTPFQIGHTCLTQGYLCVVNRHRHLFVQFVVQPLPFHTHWLHAHVLTMAVLLCIFTARCVFSVNSDRLSPADDRHCLQVLCLAF
jgi:hypothetical protein